MYQHINIGRLSGGAAARGGGSAGGGSGAAQQQQQQHQGPDPFGGTRRHDSEVATYMY